MSQRQTGDRVPFGEPVFPLRERHLVQQLRNLDVKGVPLVAADALRIVQQAFRDIFQVEFFYDLLGDVNLHDLKGDIAKTRCIRARASAIDQGKRQKTTRLRRMLALAGQTPKTFRVKIRP
ncbi:hypothetical protein EV291_101122 [Rhizobium sp. BK068]|nr:hypothetical protein [Rhizobium sp. BK060]TCM81646.1 hypothetical protein EV291_101122 [Rhizobium sp. BK068]